MSETTGDRREQIEWLRRKVSETTGDARLAGRRMAEAGDLNEGYIVSLIEAAEAALAELERAEGERDRLRDGIRGLAEVYDDGEGSVIRTATVAEALRRVLDGEDG